MYLAWIGNGSQQKYLPLFGFFIASIVIWTIIMLHNPYELASVILYLIGIRWMSTMMICDTTDMDQKNMKYLTVPFVFSVNEHVE